MSRPLNSAMMGFAVLVGEAIAIKGPPPLLPSVWGFITAFTLSSASMAINDYYDHTVDAVNEPTRPIPSGLVSPSEALAYASLLSTIGLGLAWLISVQCLILATFSLVVSLGYNTRGKQTGLVGNLMVSLCVAIPFVYGGLIVTTLGKGFEMPILFFSLMAFLSNTGREVTKGIVDVEGDTVRGIRTVAIRFGSGKAARVAAGFYLSAVGLSVAPLLYEWVSLVYAPFIIVADVGFIVSSLLLLSNHSRDNARRTKGLVLAWMGLGLIAFVAGGT